MKSSTRSNRKRNEIRPLTVVKNFCPAVDGSVLFQMGDTMVICAATVSTDVPQHARDRGRGWITAEYTMLPYSTNPRTPRRNDRPDGRSVEIQRLIGRAIRGVVDLKSLEGYLIALDCDVLRADGGTRTASINGAFIAAKLAVAGMIRDGKIGKDPFISSVAAVSVGLVDGEVLLDLDYAEDSRAMVDMNVVMDDSHRLVELQGTGEGSPFPMELHDEMIKYAASGIARIFDCYKNYIS